VDLQLEGTAAIVTGASRGLGRAAAVALVAEGARVLAVSRAQAELDELRAASPDGSVVPVICDMADLDGVAALPAAALEAFGRLDTVVNNAALTPAGPFLEDSDALWHDVFTVNVLAPAALTRAAGRHLVDQRSGHIINIASGSAIRGKPQLVAYSASKGALVQLTTALAGEWARHNVQVNAIAPGAYATEAQRFVTESPEILERRLRKIPAGRMGRPEEIGPLICLLASPLSTFITGSLFVSDGGETAKL
jgi:2-deoxy-D-gluconate 3-dehydrogenase